MLATRDIGLIVAVATLQTALLRQLLTDDKYHVLHFDLRIAGFADLDSLYMSLSQQMEQYFTYIAQTKGYEDFEKEAWGFKVSITLIIYRSRPHVDLFAV